jgi:hypothetical protein
MEKSSRRLVQRKERNDERLTAGTVHCRHGSLTLAPALRHRVRDQSVKIDHRHDERQFAEHRKPPSAEEPEGELWVEEVGERLRGRVQLVRRHGLQPYDAGNPELGYYWERRSTARLRRDATRRPP